MLNRYGRGILIFVLALAVALGAYLAYSRYLIEQSAHTVELCADLNDLKTLAALDQVPLQQLLKQVKERGFTSIGVFEETLSDAGANGEIYYLKGSGILSTKISPTPFSGLKNKGLVSQAKTYIYAPADEVRQRIYHQLTACLDKEQIKFFGRDILEIAEREEQLRPLGLGISNSTHNFLTGLGFTIIPRVWQDARYDVTKKIALLKKYAVIIFDGEEIMGYPENLPALAAAMKKYGLNYGYIEIVKQAGDQALRQLMASQVIRVHSVPKDELEKLDLQTVVTRFVRAAKERGVKLIYVRPFLPPQAVGSPVQYNLDYFSQIKQSFESAGFTFGRASLQTETTINLWQLTLLGSGVIIGTILLVSYFVALTPLLMLSLFLLATLLIYLAGGAGYFTVLQKSLALLSAITFPSLAVIANFSQKGKITFNFFDPVMIILNILGETMIGIFLMLGLLADYRFMLGVETFAGVKLALLAPMLLVGLYFFSRSGEGELIDQLRDFMKTKVSLAFVGVCLAALLAVFVLLARSGNFTLPVPALESSFRNLLETVMFIRPRTKEFLVGYPCLAIAAILFLRGRKKWLWLWAAAGAIAPISVFNSFSHIHTPVMVTFGRTINGLVLGVIFGLMIGALADRLIMKSFWHAKK